MESNNYSKKSDDSTLFLVYLISANKSKHPSYNYNPPNIQSQYKDDKPLKIPTDYLFSDLELTWSWQCHEGYCRKKLITNTNRTKDKALNLAACRLICSHAAALWPKPTGDISISKSLTSVDRNNIYITGIKLRTATTTLAEAAANIFKTKLKLRVPKNVTPTKGTSLIVTLDIQNPNIDKISLSLDESYTLKTTWKSSNVLTIQITAASFFGARHGLETLSQLIVFNDITDELQVPDYISITDKPKYPYRGILLDTSRNFIRVDKIKNVIKGMAASKMNALHWHITDSQSFPYVSVSHPELFKLGAYSLSKIYTPDDVSGIINYGREQGVRIIPEFDAPAHVGEGWQQTDFITCFNWVPWQKYCSEPPCGQFDPTNRELYDVIEDIYGDMISQFHPDIFHMGGDEVNFNCWNSTSNIVEWMSKEQGWGQAEEDFIKLWNYFQQQALERLYQKAGWEIPVIIWSSQLTRKKYIGTYLPKEKYIIQVWTKSGDEQIAELLNDGYRVILSNYDVLYLDCGFGGWLTDGNNWCSPYIGWQKIYDYKPKKIGGSKTNQILGGEVSLWSEQFDSASIDSRLWPRAAALAEVLWTEPSTDWKMAEQRFLVHRERLVVLNIDTDGVEPEWCLQNEEHCRSDAVFNKEDKH
ncbi:hypothetical protein NQ315_009246 [Exocentrus adspersus]|uniref:Beta-hexosaminidase n=1 Tax=Exocentrus adspersus TaxID=1586481 RepID=A0AAV8WFU9_9CUCU|nr:hypothetical protein NQ315_009246 [Exocentrus adspersus]